MVLTHLEIQRVQPDEGVLALQRALPERLHHLVQLLADAGDPAWHRPPGQVCRSRSVPTPAAGRRPGGTQPFDIGLLHHSQERVSPTAGEGPADSGSSSPLGPWGCAREPPPPVSPSPARGGRCGTYSAPECARTGRRQSAPPLPTPSPS